MYIIFLQIKIKRRKSEFFHLKHSNNKSLFYQNNKLEYLEDLYNMFDKLFNEDSIQSIKKYPWRIINFTNNTHFFRPSIWKIHISSNFYNYKKILNIAIPFLVKNKVNFKFISSEKGYFYINSKEIRSVASGKLITIYPNTTHVFLDILEKLYNIFKDYSFEGNYILTDQRYKDSKILYYRYVEYLPINTINNKGFIENVIVDNKYNYVSDIRNPYYTEYYWTEFFNFEIEEEQESKLLNKYNIEHIISSGGSTTTYFGYEINSNKKVFVKESREYTGLDNTGRYSNDRIINEYNNIKKLNKSYFPKILDLIEEGKRTAVYTPGFNALNKNENYSEKIMFTKLILFIFFLIIFCLNLSLKK